MSATYWLAPVIKEEPFTLGAERVACVGPAFDAFRGKLQSHAGQRFLLMFKAGLLLSDDDDSCGTDEIRHPDFANSSNLEFSAAAGFALSHCAQAFLDRLPGPREWRTYLADGHLTSADWTAEERNWLRILSDWTARDFTIVLIREES